MKHDMYEHVHLLGSSIQRSGHGSSEASSDWSGRACVRCIHTSDETQLKKNKPINRPEEPESCLSRLQVTVGLKQDFESLL